MRRFWGHWALPFKEAPGGQSALLTSLFLELADAEPRVDSDTQDFSLAMPSTSGVVIAEPLNRSIPMLPIDDPIFLH